jgi:uncharacterized protein (DUF488 family)
MTIYTIGHSNIAIERCIDLLRRYSIQVLVDTRSQPYSRYAPQFNRETLNTSLYQADITYLYLGDQLGGRPKGDQYYGQDEKVDYHWLADAPFYRAGIARLRREAEGHFLAIMCSEADYTKCHRYHLITRTLVHDGVEVQHILHSGDLVPTDLNHFRSEPCQLGLPFA